MRCQLCQRKVNTLVKRLVTVIDGVTDETQDAIALLCLKCAGVRR
jgi:hypothetical protein